MDDASKCDVAVQIEQFKNSLDDENYAKEIFGETWSAVIKQTETDVDVNDVKLRVGDLVTVVDDHHRWPAKSNGQFIYMGKDGSSYVLIDAVRCEPWRSKTLRIFRLISR